VRNKEDDKIPRLRDLRKWIKQCFVMIWIHKIDNNKTFIAIITLAAFSFVAMLLCISFLKGVCARDKLKNHSCLWGVLKN